MSLTNEFIAVSEAPEAKGTTPNVYEELANVQVGGLTLQDAADAEFRTPPPVTEVLALPESDAPASSTPELPVSEGPPSVPAAESAPLLFDQVFPETVPVADGASDPEVPLPATVTLEPESVPAEPVKIGWMGRLSKFLGLGRKKATLVVEALEVPVEAVSLDAETAATSLPVPAPTEVPLPVASAVPSEFAPPAPPAPETPEAIQTAADATLALWHRFSDSQPMERQRLAKDWITAVSQLQTDQWQALVERLGNTEPRVQAVVAESPVHFFGMITEGRLLSPAVIESLLPADVAADRSTVGDLEANAAQRFNEKVEEIQELLDNESPDSSKINRAVRTVLFTYAKLAPDQLEKLKEYELSLEQGAEGKPISWTDVLGTFTKLLLASEPQHASSS